MRLYPSFPTFKGCIFCAYETPSGVGLVPAAAPATLVVETPRGPRELCSRHATAGRWAPRSQRVSVVA